jgi:hypothetical protein
MDFHPIPRRFCVAIVMPVNGGEIGRFSDHSEQYGAEGAPDYFGLT